MAKQRWYGEGSISMEPLRDWEGSVLIEDVHIRLDVWMMLLEIPDWSIDAELV